MSDSLPPRFWQTLWNLGASLSSVSRIPDEVKLKDWSLVPLELFYSLPRK